MVSAEPLPLGAILAGGQSRRFGSPKAAALVDGAPMIERVRKALEVVLPDLVVIADPGDDHLPRDLPVKEDLRPGLGPVGGIHTALHRARDRECAGAVCVACDMPFLSADLLRGLVARARRSSADAVASERPAGGGLEPLCAYYAVRCLPRVENYIDTGGRSLLGLLEILTVEALPLEELRRFGDPGLLLFNVNTPADHRRARTGSSFPDP